MGDERVDAIERQLGELAQRLTALERLVGAPPRPVAPAEPRPAAPPPPAPEFAWTPARPKPSVNLEELLGGRLLALVGGVAVLLGVAFFVALAINRGWLGIGARVALAAVASTALFGAGAWLYERRGRTQAALAMVGASIAGMFLTDTVAGAGYHVVPAAVALSVALVIGAVTTYCAVRWSSRTVAGLGIVGALLAPALADSFTTQGIAFLAVAFGASAGVLTWRRWPWLEVTAFLIAMAELAIWIFFEHPSTGNRLAWLAVFCALNLASALAYELRVASDEPQPHAVLLVLCGASILGALGFVGLPHAEGEHTGAVWLAALAVAHGALGGFAVRARRASDEIAFVLFAAALAFADIAFGLLAHGVVLAVGWAASAAALAVVGRALTRRRELVELGLGAQLTLAIGHALLFDATPGSLGSSGGSAAGIAALAAITVAAFGAARLTLREHPHVRIALDAVSMAALAYVEALSLSGLPLVVAWTASSGALAETAHRAGDRVTAWGGVAFAALAALHALVHEAPPDALVHGSDDLLVCIGALGVVTAAAVRLATVWVVPRERLVIVGAAATAVLYLCSIAIVTPFEPGHHQQGQVLLSAFWGVCGLALWVGLRRDQRPLRIAGFTLLALAVGKVFVYDLAKLASIYRVLSLVALGMLLLLAAFAYQRLRAVERRVV